VHGRYFTALAMLVLDEQLEFAQFFEEIVLLLQRHEPYEEYRLNSIDYHSYRKHQLSHPQE
jgi:hemerythrin